MGARILDETKGWVTLFKGVALYVVRLLDGEEVVFHRFHQEGSGFPFRALETLCIFCSISEGRCGCSLKRVSTDLSHSIIVVYVVVTHGGSGPSSGGQPRVCLSFFA